MLCFTLYVSICSFLNLICQSVFLERQIIFIFSRIFFSTSSLRDFPHQWFSSILTSFEKICLKFQFLILYCFYFRVRTFLLGKYFGSTHLTLTKQNHHFCVRYLTHCPRRIPGFGMMTISSLTSSPQVLSVLHKVFPSAPFFLFLLSLSQLVSCHPCWDIALTSLTAMSKNNFKYFLVSNALF